MKEKDFFDKITDVTQDLKKIGSMVKDELEEQASENELIASIEKQMQGFEPEYTQEFEYEVNEMDPGKSTLEDRFFLNNNPLVLETRIQKEIYHNPKLLPKLTNLDRGIICIAGAIATIIDFLVVKIPNDVNYLGKFQQEGSSLSKRLQSLGVKESGELRGFFKWFEDNAKVPYDLSHHELVDGLAPRTHRLHSLAHDPFFGMIFGVIDILFGQMTTIDKAGNLIVVPTTSSSIGQKILSPMIWLSHIVSDICTKQGIPIPGWGFTQLLQVGDFGAKHRTMAELSRWMYIKGYDLRHFVTMSVPVAVIEIIVRAYHYLSYVKKQDLDSSLKPIYIKDIEKLEGNLRLHKMLFLTHTFAASGNVAKVIAYQGNPLAINFVEWIRWLDESINMVSALRREKTPKKIQRNRTKINEEWEKIRNIPINQLRLLDLDSSKYYYDLRYQRKWE